MKIPPSKLIWFSKSVPVVTKSAIPLPAPSFSKISWNALSWRVAIGTVRVVIVDPDSVIITCGLSRAAELPATPASNWTVASSLDGIPPSINANSSISNVNNSSLVLGFQS